MVLTASVTGAAPGGTVSFFNNNTLLGSATVVDGQATALGGQGIDRDRLPCQWMLARQCDDDWIAIKKLLAQDANRLERAGHGLLGRRNPEQVDVARRGDRISDPRTVSGRELELEPHPDERRQDVREDDRGVEPECVDGEERDLRSQLGSRDELEQLVALAQSPIVGEISPRLT